MGKPAYPPATCGSMTDERAEWKGGQEIAAIHSHIQLPNSVLMRFRDETDEEKKVWYLDIPSGEIRRTSTRRLGTLKDYYSSEGEIFWSRAVENSLANLANRICREPQKSPLTEGDVDTIKCYIKASAVRSRIANNAMDSGHIIATLLSNQEKRDLFAMIGMNSFGKFDEILREMGAMVLVNQTERNFVVPRNCYYCAPIVGDATIIAPISPKIAFSLFPTTAHPGFESEFAVIHSGEIVEMMNVYALKYEYMFNKEFIAANDRRELEMLQKIRKEHLSKLEALSTV